MCSGRKTTERAFTLVEMLVVMAVIVLAVAMAVPAIKFLTGSRSQEAASNTIGAYVSFSRNDAMALQQYRGVLFILDDDDRVKCCEVMQSTDQGSTSDIPGTIYLDIAGAIYPPPNSPSTPETRDNLSLPGGIRLWTLNDDDVNLGMYPGAHYVGLNQPSDFTGGTFKTGTRIGGVVLFSPEGRLVAMRYGFRFVTHQQGTGTRVPTALAQLFAQDGTQNFNPDLWPSSANNKILRSCIGLVTFDKEAFYTGSGVRGGEGNSEVQANAANAWLDANTTPEFINRYSGTVMQGQ